MEVGSGPTAAAGRAKTGLGQKNAAALNGMPG